MPPGCFRSLFGTATIPIIYLIGKRLSGPVMGLVAAVLLAFSVFNIFYAQEARMYTLLAFNAAVAIYALARAADGPTRRQPCRQPAAGVARGLAYPALGGTRDHCDRLGLAGVGRVLGGDPADPQYGGILRFGDQSLCAWPAAGAADQETSVAARASSRLLWRTG